MKDLEKDFEVLSELLRKAYDAIVPSEYKAAFMMKLFDKNFRDSMVKKNPTCYLTFKGKGREIPFFPICNMNGIKDASVISFSLNLANKLKNIPDADQDHIEMVIKKLVRLHSTYSKAIPKPHTTGYLKGTTTTNMKKIKKYLSGE
jgi:hypothetical protein